MRLALLLLVICAGCNVLAPSCDELANNRVTVAGSLAAEPSGDTIVKRCTEERWSMQLRSCWAKLRDLRFPDCPDLSTDDQRRLSSAIFQLEVNAKPARTPVAAPAASLILTIPKIGDVLVGDGDGQHTVTDDELDALFAKLDKSTHVVLRSEGTVARFDAVKARAWKAGIEHVMLGAKGTKATVELSRPQ